MMLNRSLFPIVGLDFGHEYSSIVNGTLKMTDEQIDQLRALIQCEIDYMLREEQEMSLPLSIITSIILLGKPSRRHSKND
jgi:hypothetical protein